MPISKANRALYPKNWKEIRARVMSRACVPVPEHLPGDLVKVRHVSRCECLGECGLHRTTPGPRRCIELHGFMGEFTDGRIVLTTAHLDHDPTNNDMSNLKALCQRCHNRYDQPHRQRNAAKTRHGRKATGELLAV